MNSEYHCHTQNKLKLFKLTMSYHDKKQPKMTKKSMKIKLETHKMFKFALPYLQIA